MSRISEKQIPLLRRTIGIIFQDFRLIDKKTVYENLNFAMRAVGFSPKEVRKRIPYVLKLVGLQEKSNQYPPQLSGGEQQRVAIARALINNPYTIIADEPTGNLDPARSYEIMMLLERINQLGTTVLVVTHEKDLVNRFQKRVVTLERGKPFVLDLAAPLKLERDRNFHNGPVWPFTIAAYAAAYMRVYKMSGVGFVERALVGFEQEMSELCIGTLNEIYDGNPPYKGHGAMSFAPSVSAVISMCNTLREYKEKETL